MQLFGGKRSEASADARPDPGIDAASDRLRETMAIDTASMAVSEKLSAARELTVKAEEHLAGDGDPGDPCVAAAHTAITAATEAAAELILIIEYPGMSRTPPAGPSPTSG